MVVIHSFSDIIITLQIENTSLVQNVPSGLSDVNSCTPEWALLLCFPFHKRQWVFATIPFKCCDEVCAVFCLAKHVLRFIHGVAVYFLSLGSSTVLCEHAPLPRSLVRVYIDGHLGCLFIFRRVSY